MIKLQSSIDEILDLLSECRFPEAADKWHTQQKNGGLCRNECPYGEGHNATRCTHCLEGSIRTAILKTGNNPDESHKYRMAANSIKFWLAPVG